MKRLFIIRVLAIVVVLAISSCSAKTDLNFDKKVISFEKERILSNTNLKINDISIKVKKDLPVSGWVAYTLNLKLKSSKGDFETTDKLFTDGKMVVVELFDINTGENYKEFLAPKLSEKHYTKEHLIVGKLTAKHKVAVFSDPLCPACIPYLPGLIDEIKKKKDTALYYIHLPLESLHPAAMTITKAMIKLKMDRKINNLTKKIYQANFQTEFDPEETNEQKILDGLNKKLGTKLTLKDINTKEIEAIMKKDLQIADDMEVNGTPTIYSDSKKDSSRTIYKKFK